MDVTRRGFLKLFAAAAPIAAVAPKYFFAPKGGWHRASGERLFKPLIGSVTNAAGPSNFMAVWFVHKDGSMSLPSPGTISVGDLYLTGEGVSPCAEMVANLDRLHPGWRELGADGRAKSHAILVGPERIRPIAEVLSL